MRVALFAIACLVSVNAVDLPYTDEFIQTVSDGHATIQAEAMTEAEIAADAAAVAEADAISEAAVAAVAEAGWPDIRHLFNHKETTIEDAEAELTKVT